MGWLFSRDLTDDRIAKLVESIRGAQDRDQAWRKASPLLEAHARHRGAALALAELIGDRVFRTMEAVDLLEKMAEIHRDDVEILGELAFSLAAGIDCERPTNDPPPEEPSYHRLVERLRDLGDDDNVTGLHGLAAGARTLGRAWDEVAERALRRLIVLESSVWERHLVLGQFLCNRGRLEEGRAELRRAGELGGSDDPELLREVALYALAAGDGATALSALGGLGETDLRPGLLGLPQGEYGEVHVHLAQRPFGARDADNDHPGLQDIVEVRPLSPMHGLVATPVPGGAEIGVDWGDLIVFDTDDLGRGAEVPEQLVHRRQVSTLARRPHAPIAFVVDDTTRSELEEQLATLPRTLLVHTEYGRGNRGLLCVPPGVEAADAMAALEAACAGKLRLLAAEQAEKAVAAARRAAYRRVYGR
jgi:hypothetical protein